MGVAGAWLRERVAVDALAADRCLGTGDGRKLSSGDSGGR